MIPLTAAQIAEATGGRLVAGRADALVTAGVSTDTRAIAAGSLFVALRGERFDAHDFLKQAAAAGAAAVLVDRWNGEADIAVIQVADTLLGLQRLAHWYRAQLLIPVVGITGSNGKTSTKDFTNAVLGRRFEVLATRGNLNNHIGVPLTVLSIEPHHTAAIVEMGMNHAGEIAPLCEIARPKIGIITNVGTAHIEFLGTREAIAEEKGTLARSLPEDGTLVVPAGCDFLEYFRRRTKARVIPVGNCRGAVRAEGLKMMADGSAFTLVTSDDERAEVHLPVVGRHMVTNALLAAATGKALGLSVEQIAEGLSSAQLTTGRLRRFERNGVTAVDDSYNANPESMAAAIDTLAETPVGPEGRRIVVLGAMGELGAYSLEAHHKIGRYAAERGLLLATVGPVARQMADAALAVQSSSKVHAFDTHAECAAWLRDQLHEGDVVLFKGSRSSTMEKVLNEVFPAN